MSEDVALQTAALRLAIRLDCEHERLSLAALLERAHSRLDGASAPDATASDYDVADPQEALTSARYKIEDLEDDLDGWRDAAWALAKLCGAPSRATSDYDDLTAWAQAASAPKERLDGLAEHPPAPEHVVGDLVRLFDGLEWYALADALRQSSTRRAA